MFRVTTTQSVAMTLRELTRHGAASGRLQADIASGTRIRRASDDPRGTEVVLSQRAEVQRQSTRITTIGEARARLEDASSHLLEVQQLLVKAKSLTLEGRQADQDERNIIAHEIDRLLESMVQLSNAKHQGNPLFAGSNLDASPFAVYGPSGAITYSGSQLPGQTTFSDGTSANVTYAGGAVFNSGHRGATIVIGKTGAAEGAGTSSTRGVRQLVVAHTATTFAAGSGVQAGASSAAGDTIIGPSGAHTLTINDLSGTGASGTVSLNGGPAVAFTSADGDVRVTGPDGEAVYLDLTNITPGFSGSVDITASGTMSIDGGATQTPITFADPEGVVDSRDGSIAYFDTRGILRTGSDFVEFSQTSDVFQTLSQLRDELRNVEGLPASTINAALGRRLEDLDRLSTHLLGVIGDQSVTLETFDRMEARAEDLELRARQVLESTEGTDYATAALELQQHQTAIQFSLASIVRMFDLSILNFL